jgi:hypothetical protein
MAHAPDTEPHIWRFFRAGGFDQVRIDTGRDAEALASLDQKLWVALACPTRGIEFDEATLDRIDSDKDGRIRAPELIAAVEWTISLLKDPDEISRGGDVLPLDAIDLESPRGKALRASAETILAALGKAEAREIALQDALDVERVYNGTPFNGDGIITPAAAEDALTRAAIEAVMDCIGSEQDRSHAPGISQAAADRFFAEAADYLAWAGKAQAAGTHILPLGPATVEAATTLREVAGKIDDFFARVRLAAFDPHGIDALNPPLSAYETMSAGPLAADDPAIAALPLARIEAARVLPLSDGLNPAWEGRIARFHDAVVTPILGARDALGEADWDSLKARFEPYAAWLREKPATAVEKLGAVRVASLAAGDTKARIDALIARDKAVEPQINAIAEVEKLIRFKRDLMALLNNFVSFRSFYTRAGKAAFQAGTLYLDGRSCELCVKVDDEAKHALLASLARIYLVYCRCLRDGGKTAMTIAAAFTAGDADNLIVGRNGVFYDRRGRDWDATIVKIVEHPISLRQSFWLPYRQFARFVSDQVQKFAAARAAASSVTATQSFSRAAAPVEGGAPTAAAPQPAPPAQPAQPAQQQTFDAARFAGIFAAVGLAVGAIGTAIASVVTGFLQLAWWQMPLAIIGIVLAISGPSCIIAAIKLQRRNLGPLLDASGWAVNTRLKINIPFGRTLTSLPQLPERAERSYTDPYAERKRPWAWYVVALIAIAAGFAAWRFLWPRL